MTQGLLQDERGQKTLETRRLEVPQFRRPTHKTCIQDSAPRLSSERLRRHLLSYCIINTRSPPVRSLVGIGVLLAERLQVVGVRLAATQRATRYLGGNRVLPQVVLLYGLHMVSARLRIGVRVMDLYGYTVFHPHSMAS